MLFKEDYFANAVKIPTDEITLCEDNFLTDNMDDSEILDATDLNLNNSCIEKLTIHAERDNIVDNSIILFYENPSASSPYDETGESESESITSEPNNDLGGFVEQICGPLPSNDDHVNASPSKYNTTRPGQ